MRTEPDLRHSGSSAGRALAERTELCFGAFGLTQAFAMRCFAVLSEPPGDASAIIATLRGLEHESRVTASPGEGV